MAVVGGIAAAATADALVGSRAGADDPRTNATTTTAPAKTASTTSSETIAFEPSPPVRRCRPHQLDLRSFTGEPTAVLAQVRGPDCRQPAIRIRVRITSATGASGKGTIFGPEPPAFGGVFTAGSTQVAAFRYSPACRSETPPFNVAITAGPYSDAQYLATVESCGQTFPKGPERRCADTSEEGPWIDTCAAKWLRAVVRVSGFRVSAETGSAWIARGGGSSFYIWADEVADSGGLWNEGYRRVARVRGKGLYSDGTRFTWAATGRRVWVEAGPNADDLDPDRSVLGRLVRASLGVPPPDS